MPTPPDTNPTPRPKLPLGTILAVSVPSIAALVFALLLVSSQSQLKTATVRMKAAEARAKADSDRLKEIAVNHAYGARSRDSLETLTEAAMEPSSVAANDVLKMRRWTMPESDVDKLLLNLSRTNRARFAEMLEDSQMQPLAEQVRNASQRLFWIGFDPEDPPNAEQLRSEELKAQKGHTAELTFGSTTATMRYTAKAAPSDWFKRTSNVRQRFDRHVSRSTFGIRYPSADFTVLFPATQSLTIESFNVIVEHQPNTSRDSWDPTFLTFPISPTPDFPTRAFPDSLTYSVATVNFTLTAEDLIKAAGEKNAKSASGIVIDFTDGSSVSFECSYTLQSLANPKPDPTRP
jgi:hypothetical protein